MDFNRYLILFLAVLFIGCGGSTTEKKEAFNPSPKLIITQPPVANERSTVELVVDATDDKSIKSYLWKQSSGLPVTIINSDQSIASFKAPSILLSEGVQEFVFEVLVTDNEGATTRAELNVKVQPISKTPTVNVTREIVNKSGAFTMLNWQTDGEPITQVELVANDNQPYNIDVIDHNSASFNVPQAFEQNISTTFTLIIEDEDGNTARSTIKVIGTPVQSYFKEPRIIYEKENNIYNLSNKMSAISITDNYYNLEVLDYYDGNLVPNTDFQLSTVKGDRSLFIDLNKDGFIDALTSEPDLTVGKEYCRPGQWKKVLHINYGNVDGFSEPVVFLDFGCEGNEDFIGNLTDIKDINDDDNLDLKISRSWHLYSDISQSYEVDPTYDSNWVWLHADPYPTEVEKVLLDLNSDFKTDIIQINEIEKCPDNFARPFYVCGTLLWQQKQENNSYSEPIALDSSFGNYRNFRLADVNQDGVNELVVNFSQLVEVDDSFSSRQITDEAHWYQISQDGSVEMAVLDRISHFTDLYGRQTPYFVHINFETGTLTHYQYNQAVKRPVITEVMKLAPLGNEYDKPLLLDIDLDGDIDILSNADNKIYLFENTYQ